MKVITAALLFLLTIPAGAQVQTGTFEKDIPFGAVITECRGDTTLVPQTPLPEPIAIVGTASIRRLVIDNGNRNTVGVYARVSGTATGLVTKTEYKFNAENSFRTIYEGEGNDSTPVETILKSKANVPGLYKIRYSLFLEQGDFGSITSQRLFNLHVRCPDVP